MRSYRLSTQKPKKTTIIQFKDFYFPKKFMWIQKTQFRQALEEVEFFCTKSWEKINFSFFLENFPIVFFWTFRMLFGDRTEVVSIRILYLYPSGREIFALNAECMKCLTLVVPKNVQLDT